MSTPIDPPLSRRAARQSEVTVPDAPPETFAQPLTRRPRAGSPAPLPPSAAGDVSYRTEVRPRVPHYDAPPQSHAAASADVYADIRPGSMGTGSAAPSAPPSVAPPLVAPPLVEPPVAPPSVHGGEQMRRRDFRPATEQPVPPVLPVPSSIGPQGGDTPLEYHTQMTAGVPHHMASSSAPVAPPPSYPVEQTLSRRELREIRDRSGIPPEPTTATEAFEPAATPVGEPVAVHMPYNSAPPSSAMTVDLAPPVSSESLVATVAPAEPDMSTGSHWSVGIHDDDDPFENTFSREVGSAASLSNTNALVLPEMPMGGISGPVAGTGEIIITGMIDLPRVVSSTGTVPTVHESPDIDDLFDPGDLAAGPADAAPVSALKAISSHTAARSVIMTGKRSSSNAVTTVLVASTVVMAVVAIGLFVLAAVNGLF